MIKVCMHDLQVATVVMGLLSSRDLDEALRVLDDESQNDPKLVEKIKSEVCSFISRAGLCP